MISSARRLYGILDLGYVRPEDGLSMTRRMIEGGVDILQLRAKSQSLETIRDVALAVAPVCRESGVLFILNDHPQLVGETGADGVHVGQDDMPVAAVRKIVGADALIGLSTHSLAQALAAHDAGRISESCRAQGERASRPFRDWKSYRSDVPHTGETPVPPAKIREMATCGDAAGDAGPDYIGFGPVFSTPTKPDYQPIGLGAIAEVHRRVPLPVFCIGGIKRENLREVLAAGAMRAVIVSGILQAEDPAAYCRECARILRGGT